ncbi:hypothetical protein TNCV_1634991 [Trichonephila clavipes]|nr:hypothetical protein TNCV_1634991 [Trichonephila clavipes]
MQLTVALHIQWRIFIKGGKAASVGRKGYPVGACVRHLLVCEETKREDDMRILRQWFDRDADWESLTRKKRLAWRSCGEIEVKKARHDKKSKDANSNGNISEPANGLRRSSRFRVPPLDTWRNERLVFETLPSGEVKCSIDKGSEEDKFGLIKIARKAERRIQMEKKKVQIYESTIAQC